MNIFLKKSDCYSLSSHKLPTDTPLEMYYWETSHTTLMKCFYWLDLVKVLWSHPQLLWIDVFSSHCQVKKIEFHNFSPDVLALTFFLTPFIMIFHEPWMRYPIVGWVVTIIYFKCFDQLSVSVLVQKETSLNKVNRSTSLCMITNIQNNFWQDRLRKQQHYCLP